MKHRIKKFALIFIFINVIEIAFAAINFQKFIGLEILLSIPIALFIDGLTYLFSEKTNRWIYSLWSALTIVVFVACTLYCKVIGNTLTIGTILNAASQSTEFIDLVWQELISNWWIVLAYVAICAINIFVATKIEFDKQTKFAITEFGCLILYHLIFLILLCVYPSNKIYSYKNLYFNINQTNENARVFGLMTTIKLDLEKYITNFKEKNLLDFIEEYDISEVMKHEENYNIQDIDFDAIIKNNEDNEEIKEICNYIKSQGPTNKNKYTGKYEGKNLVIMVCESFSKLAVDEDITPTIYKLMNEGLQFNNFYTPLFPVSTADGEYMIDNSLLPVEGIWTIENVEGKTYPYSLAKQLKNRGYKVYAYHDYDYSYYKRDKYFKTLGFEKYLANGMGLEKRMNFSTFPPSDYDMIKSTVDDYIKEDHFFAYYMTMSGHLGYDDGNVMKEKNGDKVQHLPYSNVSKVYMAAAIELDKAVEELINRLDKAGKLEDTVIVITGDHYPYGLDRSDRIELGESAEDEVFNKCRMPLIIYNPKNPDVKMEKVAASLDILPTLLNLFGIDYDSRLLVGRDIFSEHNNLVIFSDRSFITEKGKYNSNTGEFITTGNEKAEDVYIDLIEQEIYKKYRYSKLVFENDFYAKMLEYLK